MKKAIVIFFALLCLLLCACGAGADQPAQTTADTSKSEITATTPAQTTAGPHSPPPAYIQPMTYDSFGDLQKALNKEGEEEISIFFSEKGAPSEKVENLKIFVEKLRAKNLPVPCINGELIELRNREEYSNISLFLSDLYNLPGIYYHPKVSTGENFYIQMTYVPDDVAETIDNLTASEVIKKLAPNYPNIDRLGEQHKAIYNQNVTLFDREVTALVTEFKTDSRNSIQFVYGDWLIVVRCDSAVWDAGWFSNLSFESYVK